MSTADEEQDAGSAAAMSGLVEGYLVSQALFALADAGVMTVLFDEGPQTITALAQRTGTHEGALARLVRSLAPHGVFRTEAGAVAVTPLGAQLAATHPASMWGIAQGHQKLHYAAIAELPHTLRTGQTAAVEHFGRTYFEQVASQPQLAHLFAQAMGSFSASLRAGLFHGYRPPQGTIVDLGAGDGSILVQLLQEADVVEDGSRRAVAFDRPVALEAAAQVLEAAGLAERVDVVAGDFFDAVPSADVYLLSWILHDWDDITAGALLSTVASSATPGARVLVVEQVVPDGDGPHPSKSFDLTMLGLLGGKERTAKEYEELLVAGGFSLDRIVPLTAGFSVLEATRN